MLTNPNLTFDKSKLTLTCLEGIKADNFDEIESKIQEQLKYVTLRFQNKEQSSDTKLPYDKELIILPRQLTYVPKMKETNSKFKKIKKNRMIYDEQSKDWILRRHKKKQSNIPPIIEATKQNAYEDVFRKKEMEQELKKHQKELRSMKRQKLKQKKLEQIKKQL